MSFRRSSVQVEKDDCWGQESGEDGQTEACRRCVTICPTVFEKPDIDRPARVKLVVQVGMDLTEEIKRKLKAAHWRCPSDAIRLRGFK